jgi:hypothetical protein
MFCNYKADSNVGTWPKTCTVFYRPNTGIVGSNPTRGMYVVYARVSSVFVFPV